MEIRIQKTVLLNRNISDVFNYLKITSNQDNFSVWNMTDPGMKKTLTGADGTVGFKYAWDSTNKNVGAGEQEITNIVDNQRIDYSINFYRPMQNTGKASFILRKAGEAQTEVTWTFSSPAKFPMSLLAPLFKSMLGKQINKGLQNLKGILESK